MHHLCYEVDDVIAARDRLKAAGARVLGDGEPKIGAHGKPVLFLHPKDFAGERLTPTGAVGCALILVGAIAVEAAPALARRSAARA
jgi:catechol 2,3-dioxygenase-like lactoylglutathione lyase family enzyme